MACPDMHASTEVVFSQVQHHPLITHAETHQAVRQDLTQLVEGCEAEELWFAIACTHQKFQKVSSFVQWGEHKCIFLGVQQGR